MEFSDCKYLIIVNKSKQKTDRSISTKGWFILNELNTQGNRTPVNNCYLYNRKNQDMMKLTH